MSATVLLLQLIVILGTARACGWLLRHLGQPAVVGEMAAGLMLGPIVMGALFPHWHAQLFPPTALAGLQALATVGLVLFMFVVGLELRSHQGMRSLIKSAGAVGILSVAVPLVLGVAISPLLYPALVPAGVGYWPFAGFMAAALSITAFPVMARILKDRGQTHTSFGQLSMGAAAVADMFAWILLAVVVAWTGASEGTAGLVKTGGGVLAMLVLLFLAVKPLFAWLLRRHARDGELSPAMMASLMLGLLGTALFSEWVGLHAVFGAFLFGAILPRDDRLLDPLVQRIEPMSIAVLMPLFFALAGLGTTSDAFVSGSLGLCLLVIFVAALGKIAGGAAGARLSGYGWRDSLATGSLMNARGLMELIVMKIGLDAGLIGPQLFTMLLLMALVTTAMTSPMLSLVQGRRVAPVVPQGESGNAGNCPP
ncbi:MAG: cation:proton antiporter [Proteobacteria bacterium]|nr:cation:proton antiporter [Pseudomonadota bacterium]